MTRPSDKHLIELGEIVAGIAHDLASPINVVLFCAESYAEAPELAKDERYQSRLLDAAKNLRQAVESLRQICASGNSMAQGSLADAHRLAANLVEMGAGRHIHFNATIDDSLWSKKRPYGLAEMTSQLYKLYREVWKGGPTDGPITYTVNCQEHSSNRLEVTVTLDAKELAKTSFSPLN